METFRQQLEATRNAPVQTYMGFTVGDAGVYRLFLYELLTSILGPLPGGAGFLLRKVFYKALFKHVGKGLIIGRNVVIRHPGKITIGDNVTIDDNCLIDARGSGEHGIVLEDRVIVNRNCMIQSKSGPVRVGRRTSLGSNSVIVSLCGVDFGEGVLTAGGVYISAGTYDDNDPETPIADQKAHTEGPINIGRNSWIGTCAVILDGINVGEGAVVGAGAVVTKDVPSHAIAAGVPAKVIKNRRNQPSDMQNTNKAEYER